MSKFIEWAIEQHRKTNHLYDKILPYEFHLNMVAKEVIRHLGNCNESMQGLNPIVVKEILVHAAYGMIL